MGAQDGGTTPRARRGGAVRLPRLLLLLVVWLALWGDVSWANLLSGVAVGVVVLVLAPPVARPLGHRVALLPSLRYLAAFVVDLVVSTLQVAAQVVRPRVRLRPAVLEVPLRSSDPVLLSLVANTITLTPGTLTIETERDTARIWVHVLHLEDRPGAAEDVLRHAQGLERLGARALGVDLDATAPGRHPAAPRQEG